MGEAEGEKEQEKAEVSEEVQKILDYKGKGEDLSDGDGGVLKSILKEGEGETPEEGFEIVAHYTGTVDLNSVLKMHGTGF